jgi:hypothetical protein
MRQSIFTKQNPVLARSGGNRRTVFTMASMFSLPHSFLWSALAFVLNLAWEIAHVRLYTIWETADGAGVAWAVLHCSLGDVVIAFAMFALASIALRSANWPVSRPWAGGAIVMSGAMAYTAWSEWHNVYRTGTWGYAESMPTIFGIGLSPLLQWLILPPLIIGAYRAATRALDLSESKAGVRHGKT